jgi:hypothetical protein
VAQKIYQRHYYSSDDWSPWRGNACARQVRPAAATNIQQELPSTASTLHALLPAFRPYSGSTVATIQKCGTVVHVLCLHEHCCSSLAHLLPVALRVVQMRHSDVEQHSSKSAGLHIAQQWPCSSS